MCLPPIARLIRDARGRTFIVALHAHADQARKCAKLAPPKNHMMHDGALTSAIFVLVAVDARAERCSQGGREGEDRGIDHGKV